MQSSPGFATFFRVVGRVSIVSFDHQGHEWYCVTAGRTVFEAVRNAICFFADPYWRRRPKTRTDTVFKVALVGDERKWRVRASSVNNHIFAKLNVL